MKVETGLTITIEYKIETDKGELIESSLGKGASECVWARGGGWIWSPIRLAFSCGVVLLV